MYLIGCDCAPTLVLKDDALTAVTIMGERSMQAHVRILVYKTGMTGCVTDAITPAKE